MKIIVNFQDNIPLRGIHTFSLFYRSDEQFERKFLVSRRRREHKID